MAYLPPKSVRIWLYALSACIVLLILFGGFVRLSRSGLSIVEWHVITGVIPPMGEAGWQEAFQKYQQTPEFKYVNTTMTLSEYKTIYLIEYTHRLVARLAGLLVILPLMFFLIRGIIPLRHALPYITIGALFVSQGLFGWYMVQSGLADEPRVSPYLLTAHLLIALSLLALCLWKGLQHTLTTSPRLRIVTLENASTREPRWTDLKWVAYALFGLIIVQIAYGGLVAGLKAGYVSDTFPLMFGYLVPPGMFSIENPWFLNLISTEMTVHFVHRWLAFVVLGLAALLNYLFRNRQVPMIIQINTSVIIILVSIQIFLGIGVIQFHVPISLALIHQGVGVLVFVNGFLLAYHFIKAERHATPQYNRIYSEVAHDRS